MDSWYHVYFLFGICFYLKQSNSFNSFCNEFLSGVHYCFPFVVKKKKRKKERKKKKKTRSTEGSVRPAIVYILGTGHGQKYSVSVLVQVLKSMYTKRAGTQHNIQKLSDKPGHLQSLIRAFVMRFNGKLKTQTVFSWTASILIRLCGQPGWYESL